jgi:hypothetical protein
MKLSTDTNQITTNVSSGVTATMKVCPTAFKILSSQIYQDKISAVIREVSCNAVDAHKAAGKEHQPITVTLPTRFDPVFIVDDEGTGINPDIIMNMYMTYFESTKSDSNDEIGGFGLGSKSPLAYTDQFTVKNRWNGVETSYMIYFNAQHVPDITKISEKETDRPNGVTVVVPVKDRDVYDFGSKARNIYKWFAVKPEIKGNEVDIYDVVYEHEVEGLYAITEGVHGTGVLMGGVFYKMSASDLVNGMPLFSHLANSMNNRIVLPFNIGDLEVQASRESLSLDPTTVETLKKRAEDIEKSLVDDIQKKIDTCSEFYEIPDVLAYVEEKLVKQFPSLFSLNGVKLDDDSVNGSVEVDGSMRVDMIDSNTVRVVKGYRKKHDFLHVEKVSYNKVWHEYDILVVDKVKHLKYVREHLFQGGERILYTTKSEEVKDYLLECLDGCKVNVHYLTDMLSKGVVNLPSRSSSASESGHLYFVVDGGSRGSNSRATLKELYDMIDDNTYFEEYDFVSGNGVALHSACNILQDGYKVVYVNHTNLQKIIDKGGKRFRKEYVPSDEVKKHIFHVYKLNRTIRAYPILDMFRSYYVNGAVKKLVNTGVIDIDKQFFEDYQQYSRGELDSINAFFDEAEKQTDVFHCSDEVIGMHDVVDMLYSSRRDFINAVSNNPEYVLTTMIKLASMNKQQKEAA